MRIVPLFHRIIIGVAILFSGWLVHSVDAAAGDLYTKDFNGNEIIRIARDGTKTLFALGDGSQTTGMTFDRAGNLYVAAGNNILKFAPDGTRATFAAGTGSLNDLVFDSAGNLFASQNSSHSIFKFAPDGTRTVFASGLGNPGGMTFDRAGNLFVVQGSGGPVLKFRPDGTSTIFAPAPDMMHPFSGVAVDAADNVYLLEFVPGTIYKYSPDGTSRTVFVPPFNSSTGSIEFDSAGNLYAFVEGQGAIYKITPAGTKTLFASTPGFAAWGAFEPPRGFPLNFSTRLRIQTGENVMMGGFIISGTDPTTVVIRGMGPSLLRSGVIGVLVDPTLELHDNTGAVIAANDNWRDTQAAELQASGLAPDNDLEAAMLVTLPPGSYTAVVQGRNGLSGVGLVEVYDLDRANHSKLLNISTRGRVETGSNVLIGGFILGDNGCRIIVRALGPSLMNAGIQQALLDPTLTLFDGNGAVLASNDNWKDSQEIAIRGTGLAPSNDSEPAILTTVAPGPYTAVVQDRNGATGVAVVEVYNLQ